MKVLQNTDFFKKILDFQFFFVFLQQIGSSDIKETKDFKKG